MFSARAQVPARAVNEFSSRVASLRHQGLIRYDLTGSNPTRAGIDYDWARLKLALGSAPLEHYSPDSLGARSARQHIVDHLARSPSDDGFFDMSVGGELSADRMLLTASTSEAYGYLFKLLCEPGDVVLAPSPSYPLIERLAAYEGVTAEPYALAYDGAWHVDRDSVLAGLSHAPKAIVVVSPNNPTGSCVSAQEWEFLSTLGVPLIVDQVFAPYVTRAGAATGCEFGRSATLTFVLDGLSKRCGLPQLKLAWVSVSGPEPAVGAAMHALGHLADTYLSVNRPVEAAVGELLASTCEVRRNIRNRLSLNLDTLLATTQHTSLTPLHYQGGWTAIVRLPGYCSDDEWALHALDQGVLAQPGWLYDMPIPATLVLSLLTPPSDFAAGLDALCELGKG